MNLLRIGVLAPELPKKRRPSGRDKKPLHSIADVDEYNQRQLMRCVETRNRHQGDTCGPAGLKNATTLQRVEVATKELPPIELAAYMAKIQGTQEHQNLLVGEVERMMLSVSRKQKWRYYNKAGQTDPIRLLASIVVEEWLNPSKYWRLSAEVHNDQLLIAKISAFARVMQCTRNTWHSTWKARFLVFQGYPQIWFDIGELRMNESSGGFAN